MTENISNLDSIDQASKTICQDALELTNAYKDLGYTDKESSEAIESVHYFDTNFNF